MAGAPMASEMLRGIAWSIIPYAERILLPGGAFSVVSA
jgi:hypothetical protein